MQVVRLPVTPVKAPRQAPGARRAARRLALTASAVGFVAFTLTGLSLSHLATGIALVTGTSNLQSWAMAVGIDMGFVTLEVAMLACPAKLRQAAAVYANPAIIGTLIGSAALNAFAFAGAAANVYTMAAGCVLGVAIPALIYASTKVGALMWLHAQA